MAMIPAGTGLCCSARSRFGEKSLNTKRGYRSQFGKIVSLDYGDLELLEKFRNIYRVNQVART